MAPAKLVRPVGHDASVFVLSLSGGKDSLATHLALVEAGIEHRVVAADTGWEADKPGVASWLEYLATIERICGITIDRVGKPGGMRAAMDKRAGFPARMQRWCTRELKIEVLRAYHDAIEEEESTDTICVVGIRGQESRRRAKMPDFEFDEPGERKWGGYIWRPIMGWKIEDVLAIHHRHGVPVNPMYRLGFDRVGCNPCIYAKKRDIALTAQHFPERIDEIREREQRYVALRQARNIETPGRYAHADDASFFQAKVRRRVGPRRIEIVTNPETGKTRRKDVSTYVYDPMTIDQVVAWAQTSRGGRQLKVIQDKPEGGCFSWGLCDATAAEVA